MIGTSAASVTNQRLDAARQLLAQCDRLNDDWMLSSYETSAVFQLRSALNGLLQELKAVYVLDDSLSIHVLVSSATSKGAVVPALQELAELENNSSSWLNQLYKSYQAALECKSQGQVVSTGSNDLIGKGSDDAASTKFILNSLVELVLRFREDAAEY